jgi:hypothetical protein
LPLAAQKQAFLRCMAQMPLVVHPASGNPPPQPQFLEQFLHFAAIVRRAPAGVVDATLPQRPGCRQVRLA